MYCEGLETIIVSFLNDKTHTFVNGRDGVALSPQNRDTTLVVYGCTVRSHDYQQCVRLNLNGGNIIDWFLSLHAHTEVRTPTVDSSEEEELEWRRLASENKRGGPVLNINDGATAGPSSVSDDGSMPGPSCLNRSIMLIEISDDDDDDDE